MSDQALEAFIEDSLYDAYADAMLRSFPEIRPVEFMSLDEAIHWLAETGARRSAMHAAYRHRQLARRRRNRG